MIRYPEGWTVARGQDGMHSMAHSANRKDSNSSATLYVNVVTTSATSAKEFFNLSKKEYDSTFTDIKFGRNRPVVLSSGVSVHELFFDATKNNRKMRYRVFYAAKEGIGYSFTATSPIESFEKDNNVHYEKALQSIYVEGYKVESAIKREDYSITYPESWEVSAAEASSNSRARTPHSAEKNYREGIFVSCDESEEVDLKTFAHNMMSSSAVKPTTESELILRNGRVVYEVNIEFKMRGKQIQAQLVFALESGRGCMIRYAAEPQNFETYKPDFDNALETFSIQ